MWPGYLEKKTRKTPPRRWGRQDVGSQILISHICCFSFIHIKESNGFSIASHPSALCVYLEKYTSIFLSFGKSRPQTGVKQNLSLQGGGNYVIHCCAIKPTPRHFICYRFYPSTPRDWYIPSSISLEQFQDNTGTSNGRLRRGWRNKLFFFIMKYAAYQQVHGLIKDTS